MKNKFTFLILCVVLSLFGKERVDILFYLQDAGETYALIPVLRELKEREISLKVLTGGVAGDLLPDEFSHLSFPHLVVDKKWSRDQLAKSEDLQPLLEAIEPQLLVTGVAYALQGQVLSAYRDQGVFTVAYWDNFNRTGDNPYFKTADSVTTYANRVFVPTSSLANTFEVMGLTVGQPTLEQWKGEIEAIDPMAIRQKLGICTCKEIILFIGGYGEEYRHSLELFVQSMKKSSVPSDPFILIQPHPKCSDGAVEEIALQDATFPYRILMNEVTTKEAVAVANLVACHQSTVSFQALAVGKPVIHFIPENQSFTTIPLEKGVAHKVSVPEEFPLVWEKALETANHTDFFEAIGAPRNSAKLFAETLLEILH